MPMTAILNAPLALIGPLGHWEIGAILVIAVLLFGRRLPDVGRNVGKAIIEFKRGVKGITDEIDQESSKPGGPGQSSAPELEAPRGTAYHDPVAQDANPAPVPAPDATPGDGQPRTS